MKKIDFERAAVLMDVMSKVATVGPLWISIAGEAGEELKAINEDCLANGRERADKIRQEEQVAQQQRLEATADDKPQNRSGIEQEHPHNILEPTAPVERRL